MADLSRITVDAKVMGGKACIRGLRFPVSRLLNLLASGQSEAEVLKNHPDLEPEDIRAAMAYAAALAEDRIIVLKSA
ncbi:MAG: DUF433 domain-containing protein [bacterium]|jgi:uncharacterized protein (DUF433 family)|nr:DUF433 domain-containing protein [Phycisphaerales bacterium]MCE2654344.1 DUF433 domain-containing protein [Planctomycetaceae bacterium]